MSVTGMQPNSGMTSFAVGAICSTCTQQFYAIVDKVRELFLTILQTLLPCFFKKEAPKVTPPPQSNTVTQSVASSVLNPAKETKPVESVESTESKSTKTQPSSEEEDIKMPEDDASDSEVLVSEGEDSDDADGVADNSEEDWNAEIEAEDQAAPNGDGVPVEKQPEEPEAVEQPEEPVGAVGGDQTPPDVELILIAEEPAAEDVDPEGKLRQELDAGEDDLARTVIAMGPSGIEGSSEE